MRKMLLAVLLWASTCSLAIAQDRQTTGATRSGAALPELIKDIETESQSLANSIWRQSSSPKAKRVGDIIDVTSNYKTLIAGADDCFPSLKPRATPSQLPQL